MENSRLLPLFPLELVVFPGEKLNLHIFEPRYQELLADVIKEQTTFGIPAYIGKKIEYGTEMELLKVVRRYPDGRADISTRGLKVIQVLEYVNPVEGKLYAGGKVRYLENEGEVSIQSRNQFLSLVKELYMSMNIVQQVEVDEDLSAWDLGHRIGLSKQQEYYLLQMMDENERINYLIRHLEKTIPILQEVERTREIIKQNGHFKHFDPLNF